MGNTSGWIHNGLLEKFKIMCLPLITIEVEDIYIFGFMVTGFLLNGWILGVSHSSTVVGSSWEAAWPTWRDALGCKQSDSCLKQTVLQVGYNVRTCIQALTGVKLKLPERILIIKAPLPTLPCSSYGPASYLDWEAVTGLTSHRCTYACIFIIITDTHTQSSILMCPSPASLLPAPC